MDNTPNELMTFLKGFKSSMEDKMEGVKSSMAEMELKIETTNRKIDGRFDTISKEVKKVSDNMAFSDAKYEAANKRMDERLSELEKEMKRSSVIRRRSEDLRMQEKEQREIPIKNTITEENKQKVAVVTEEILTQPPGVFR